MIDVKQFEQELYEAFLEEHPGLKADDSELAKFALVMAGVATAAIAKYDRETSR